MLEIPACNAGAYREYLVCHETLQDRPRLRLPVCGETAVLSVLFHSPTRSYVLFILSFLLCPFPSLSLSLSRTRFSRSSSILFTPPGFSSPFINYNEPREPPAGINRWKIPLSACGTSAPAFILFPFNLPEILPPSYGDAEVHDQSSLEYRCLLTLARPTDPPCFARCFTLVSIRIASIRL